MHNESQVGLALRSQHTCRGKARVVDQQWVVIAFPFDGVGRIRDDQFEGFIIPVLRIDQGIFALDIKLIEIHIVQKHINTAQVIGGDVDLLPEEADLDGILAQYLQRLQ